MKRVALGVGLISALSLAAPVTGLHAQDAQQVASVDPWTSEELENLLAPIALYPDPILAQVLVAATYPDQVLAAQSYVRAFGPDRIDDQPWEISVKAVAHYTPVLNLMAEGEDWMTALGQAYATQPRDVMSAVQSLRRMANAQGNLASTEQQVVVVEREVIRIEPAQPRIIYVPTYDPAVVYFRPVYIARAHPSHWAWGVGYPIGVWLTYDFDWYNHHVYYHGWHRGPRWVVVSRPWVVISPIYIGPRYTTVVINRRIVDRRFNAYRLRGYTNVHRHVTYDRRGPRRDVARGWTGGRGVTPDRYRPARPARGDDRNDGPNRPSGPNRPERGDGPDRPDRPNRGGEPDRVRPIQGAPSRTPAAAQPPKRAVASEGARTPSRPSRETERVSNGTWNPRPTTAGTNAPRTNAPRASVPSATTPRETSPRATSPRASTPRASTPQATTPKASAPRASAPARSDAPRPSARPSAPKGSAPAAAPRSSGSNGRASAPRSSGPSRASAPRSSSGGRASAPRSSGGSKGGSSAGRRGGN